MSCYFRHMKHILDEAGVEVTPENRKQVHRAIHEIAGVSYKDCPTTWRALKEDVLTDAAKRQELVRRLKSAAG